MVKNITKITILIFTLFMMTGCNIADILCAHCDVSTLGDYETEDDRVLNVYWDYSTLDENAGYNQHKLHCLQFLNQTLSEKLVSQLKFFFL